MSSWDTAAASSGWGNNDAAAKSGKASGHSTFNHNDERETNAPGKFTSNLSQTSTYLKFVF